MGVCNNFFARDENPYLPLNAVRPLLRWCRCSTLFLKRLLGARLLYRFPRRRSMNVLMLAPLLG